MQNLAGSIAVAAAPVRRRISRSLVIWTIAIVEVVLLAQAVAVFAWSGRWFPSEFAIPGSAAVALVGALIASRQPGNRFGWYMLMMPVPGMIAFLCSEYSAVIELSNLQLPGLRFVTWVGEWVWTPSFGIGITMLTARFPDGRVTGRWRFIDLIAIVGTLLLGATIAWMVLPGTVLHVTPFQVGLVSVSLVMIAIAGVGAVSSLYWRYRHGGKDLRQQVKWMLLATIVMALALIVAVVLQVAFSATLDWVLAPFYAALISVPIAIGVAILRHHLFDIDLIISRTLVYVIVTGVLGGLYIGMIEFMQQVSILYTGQRSETAIVLTAFVVAGAFTPIQKWADNVVERRFRGSDPAAKLQGVSASAESAVRVMNPHRFAQWLVEECVVSFAAEGGVLYLKAYHDTRPFHCRGTVGPDPAVTIPVHHAGQELGRLELGRRRGGIEYSHRDVEALTRSADALGSALAVADELGHLPHPAIDSSDLR